MKYACHVCCDKNNVDTFYGLRGKTFVYCAKIHNSCVTPVIRICYKVLC